MTGIVIVNRHEPHAAVAGRLLDLAVELGFGVRSVVAQRGEHDAALSFQVPQDVADAFDEERADRWPASVDDGDPSTPPARKARPSKTKE